MPPYFFELFTSQNNRGTASSVFKNVIEWPEPESHVWRSTLKGSNSIDNSILKFF